MCVTLSTVLIVSITIMSKPHRRGQVAVEIETLQLHGVQPQSSVNVGMYRASRKLDFTLFFAIFSEKVNPK